MAISTVAPRLVLVRMAEADDTSDEELVKRAQGGDRTALDRLVRRHQRALFALCLRYVRDADEAADLVQRSFVRAMGKLAELRDAGVFRSWILRIGAHLALNHIRDHARFVADDGNIEAAISDVHRAKLSEGRTLVTNLFSGGLTRGAHGRLVDELGPVRSEAPPYPLASAALAPIRAATEQQGERGFGPMWAGQAGPLGERLPADELTRRLAADALAILHSRA